MACWGATIMVVLKNKLPNSPAKQFKLFTIPFILKKAQLVNNAFKSVIALVIFEIKYRKINKV